MNLKRYLTIYAALWKNFRAREMSFKRHVLVEFCFITVL
jgi:hypothetical protein